MMRKKFSSVWIATAWLCSSVFLLLGCTHPLTIRNMSTYRSSGVTSLEQPVRIGIVSNTNSSDERMLANGVANALGSYSAQVLMPYNLNSAREVDVIANLDISSTHNGSGWNFLVNFPGFLIFAPAWNGYLYKVDYVVTCSLVNAETKKTIDEFTLPISLDIRHAAMNRTWTEISWFEVGVIAFIGGLVFIQYDDSVTPLVGEKVESPLGKYIAQEIVRRINNNGGLSQIHVLSEHSALARY